MPCASRGYIITKSLTRNKHLSLLYFWEKAWSAAKTTRISRKDLSKGEGQLLNSRLWLSLIPTVNSKFILTKSIFGLFDFYCLCILQNSSSKWPKMEFVEIHFSKSIFQVVQMWRLESFKIFWSSWTSKSKNLSNFVYPVWKLHNPYCHTGHPLNWPQFSKSDFLLYGTSMYYVSRFLGFFDIKSKHLSLPPISIK